MVSMVVNVMMKLIINVVVIGNAYDELLINILVVNIVQCIVLLALHCNVLTTHSSTSRSREHLSRIYLYNWVHGQCIVASHCTFHSSFNRFRFFPLILFVMFTLGRANMKLHS